MPIQDINYDSANIWELTCPFRHCLCFHILNRQSGSKGEICRDIAITMLVQAEKEIFFYTKAACSRQIVIDRHSLRLKPNQCLTNYL
jgi:hypothetical protein